MNESIKLQSIKEIFKSDFPQENISIINSNWNDRLGSEHEAWSSIAVLSQSISEINSEYVTETKRNNSIHKNADTEFQETIRKEITPDDSISKWDHSDSYKELEIVEERLASLNKVNCTSLHEDQIEIEISDSTNSKELSFNECSKLNDVIMKLWRNNIDSDLEAINLQISKWDSDEEHFVSLIKRKFPTLK